MTDTATAHTGRDFADDANDADILAAIGAARPISDTPLPLFRSSGASPDYPSHALGPVLAPAARAIASQAQCAMACAASSVLAVASLAAQGHADAVLPIGQGKPTPLSLYFLTVLESGERKSTADTFALKPVREYERELADAEAAERQDWAIKHAAHETAAKELHRTHKKDRTALEAALQQLGPAPLPPLASILAPGGDQTFEGLFRVYERGRPSLAMLCDDGATFLGGHSLKKENKAGTTANLCRAWDGSRLERIRAMDGVTVLYDRRLACHVMVQPGVAADFMSDRQFADQGLLARFLIASPASLAGTAARIRTEDPAEEARAAQEAERDLVRYCWSIGKLLRAPIRWRNENDRAAGVELRSLPLSGDARTLYIQFHNATMAAMGPGQPLESIKPFASKLAENAVRIAGILALVSNPEAAEIEAAVLANGMALAKFYADEALRLSEAVAVAPALRQAEQLRRWLLSRDSDLIALVTIYQLGQPKSIRSAQAARDAMQILADHAAVIPLPGGAVIGGVRHKEAWRIVREPTL